jgi:hypothetical protein
MFELFSPPGHKAHQVIHFKKVVLCFLGVLVSWWRLLFLRTWISACKEAGVPGRILHDFDRMAARKLVRAALPERVAMTVAGTVSNNASDSTSLQSAQSAQNDVFPSVRL